MRSNRALKAWYREINTKFFDSELPDNVCVRWAEDPDEEPDLASVDNANDGKNKYEIVINKEKNSVVSIRLSTLVHEMIHVATELRDDHGPAFERWRSLLAERGIFKKGALYRGVTLF